jgi:hypothetical protein
LHHLHLPFDLIWVDAQTDILKRGIAQNLHLAGVAIHLHIRPCAAAFGAKATELKASLALAKLITAPPLRIVRWAISARIMPRSGDPCTQKRLRHR